MAYTLQSGKLIQLMAGQSAINILCNAQPSRITELELTFSNVNLNGGTIQFNSLQVEGYEGEAISDNANASPYTTFTNATATISAAGTYSISDIHSDAMQILVVGGTSPAFDLLIANNGSQRQFFIEII